jgi:CheY-like chemotaxis protein
LNCKILTRHLQTISKKIDQIFDITEVSDGLIAVECVKKSIEISRHYDFIFMDYVMIDLQGPEAVKQIRALNYQGFIIGVTGNILDGDIKHFYDCGLNEILTKPIVESKLHNTIIRLLPLPMIDS